MEFKFKLGLTAKDKVTGFTGVITSRIEYINGCIQYCVKPKMMEAGKMPDGEYLDEQQIEIVEGEVKIEQSPTGGAQRDCPQY